MSEEQYARSLAIEHQPAPVSNVDPAIDESEDHPYDGSRPWEEAPVDASFEDVPPEIACPPDCDPVEQVDGTVAFYPRVASEAVMHVRRLEQRRREAAEALKEDPPDTRTPEQVVREAMREARGETDDQIVEKDLMPRTPEAIRREAELHRLQQALANRPVPTR
jgi:hypothetical protein